MAGLSTPKVCEINTDIDLSTGLANYREAPLKYVSSGGLVPNGTTQPPSNIKYLQGSGWNQYQLFSEVALRPISALEITPGVKYMSFTRYVAADVNQTSRIPLDAQATFDDVLPFLTVNYELAKNPFGLLPVCPRDVRPRYYELLFARSNPAHLHQQPQSPDLNQLPVRCSLSRDKIHFRWRRLSD